MVNSIHDEQSRLDRARAEQARNRVVLNVEVKVEQDVRSNPKHPPNGPLNA